MEGRTEGRTDICKFPPEFYRASALWSSCPKARCNGRIDEPTNIVGSRVACTRLEKNVINLFFYTTICVSFYSGYKRASGNPIHANAAEVERRLFG